MYQRNGGSADKLGRPIFGVGGGGDSLARRVPLAECGDPYCGQDVSLNIYAAPCCYQIRFKIHVDWRAMAVD